MENEARLIRERDEARAANAILAEHLQEIVDSIEGGGMLVTFSEYHLTAYQAALALARRAAR